DGEFRHIQHAGVVPRAGRDCDLFVDNEAEIEVAVRTTAENVREHFKGYGLASLASREGWYQILALQARHLDTGIGERERASRNWRRFLRAHPRRQGTVTGYFAVGFFCKRSRLRRAYVAGNYDNRIIGGVEAAVESDRVITRQLFHFVAPADHRFAVGMIEIERCIDLLGQASPQIVSSARVLPLENNIPLGQNDLVGRLKAGHPICFEFHNGLQLVAWHALEIARVVLRREGIPLPADARNHLREFSGRVFSSALEHEMFKEMRQPRLACRLIRCANLVPDPMRNHGCSMIWDDHKLQSVGKNEVCDFGVTLIGGERRGCQSASKRDERQIYSGKHDVGPEYVAIVPQHEIGLRRQLPLKARSEAVTVIESAQNVWCNSRLPWELRACQGHRVGPEMVFDSRVEDRSINPAVVRP